MDSRRREGDGRQDHEVDDRGRQPQCTDPPRGDGAALKVGMEVMVDGYQAKDGSPRANGRDITLADGRKLSVSSPGTGAPEQ